MEAAHEDGETVIPFPPLYENITYDVISPHVPSIHQLNDECLDMIFSYMHPCDYFKLKSVCRRWHNLCITKLAMYASKIASEPGPSSQETTRYKQMSYYI